MVLKFGHRQVVLELDALRIDINRARQNGDRGLRPLLLQQAVGKFVDSPAIAIDLILAPLEVRDRSAAFVRLIGESPGHRICDFVLRLTYQQVFRHICSAFGS